MSRVLFKEGGFFLLVRSFSVAPLESTADFLKILFKYFLTNLPKAASLGFFNQVSVVPKMLAPFWSGMLVRIIGKFSVVRPGFYYQGITVLHGLCSSCGSAQAFFIQFENTGVVAFCTWSPPTGLKEYL